MSPSEQLISYSSVDTTYDTERLVGTPPESYHTIWYHSEGGNVHRRDAPPINRKLTFAKNRVPFLSSIRKTSKHRFKIHGGNHRILLLLCINSANRPSATVRLTSIHYRVSGNQNFCFAPTETIDGRVKKNTRCAWAGGMGSE